MNRYPMTSMEGLYTTRAQVGRGITRALVYVSGPEIADHQLKTAWRDVCGRHPTMLARPVFDTLQKRHYWIYSPLTDVEVQESITVYNDISNEYIDKITEDFPAFDISKIQWRLIFIRKQQGLSILCLFYSHGLSDTVGIEYIIEDFLHCVSSNDLDSEKKSVVPLNQLAVSMRKFAGTSIIRSLVLGAKEWASAKTIPTVREEFVPSTQSFLNKRSGTTIYVSLSQGDTNRLLRQSKDWNSSFTSFLSAAFFQASLSVLQPYFGERSRAVEKNTFVIIRNANMDREENQSAVFLSIEMLWLRVDAEYGHRDMAIHISDVMKNSVPVAPRTQIHHVDYAFSILKPSGNCLINSSNHGRSRLSKEIGLHEVLAFWAVTPTPGLYTQTLFIHTLKDNLTFSYFSGNEQPDDKLGGKIVLDLLERLNIAEGDTFMTNSPSAILDEITRGR